jgi:hypothetical protein
MTARSRKQGSVAQNRLKSFGAELSTVTQFAPLKSYDGKTHEPFGQFVKKLGLRTVSIMPPYLPALDGKLSMNDPEAICTPDRATLNRSRTLPSGTLLPHPLWSAAR